MPTDEQKADPNYRWTFQGKNFKYCPNCKKAIIAEWTSHNCGYGKAEEAKPVQSANQEDMNQEAVGLVQECLIEAKDILNNTKLNMDEFISAESIIAVADQIRRTKIVLKYPMRK